MTAVSIIISTVRPELVEGRLKKVPIPFMVRPDHHERKKIPRFIEGLMVPQKVVIPVKTGVQEIVTA